MGGILPSGAPFVQDMENLKSLPATHKVHTVLEFHIPAERRTDESSSMAETENTELKRNVVDLGGMKNSQLKIGLNMHCQLRSLRINIKFPN